MAFMQSGRERMLVGLTTLAVLAGGGYLFVFRPGIEYYRDLETRIERRKQTWEEKRERLIKSQQYRAQFDKIRESLSLPGTEQDKKSRIAQDLTALLEGINIVAKNYPAPNAEQIDDDFRIYTFSLRTIQTDWPTLARLLYEIENSDSVLEVSSLSVKENRVRRQNAEEIVVDLDISRMVEHPQARRTRRPRR